MIADAERIERARCEANAAHRELATAYRRADEARAVLARLTGHGRSDATADPVRAGWTVTSRGGPMGYRDQIASIHLALQEQRHVPLIARAGAIEGAMMDLMGVLTEMAAEIDAAADPERPSGDAGWPS